jgi:hypothetical protein
MTTITTYKILEVGGTQYLQYLKSYKWFWFFKTYNWVSIPFPNAKGKPQVVCDKINEYHLVKKFIIKYPNIENYFNTEFKERKTKFRAGKY